MLRSGFWAKPQQGCGESADYFLLYLWRSDFSSQKCAIIQIIRKAYSFLLRLPGWGPGLEPGAAHMLQNLCNKSLKVFESPKSINVFCHTHGMERGDGSHKWLLRLRGSSSSARFSQEEELDLMSSEYTICYAASTPRWRPSLSWTSRYSCTGIG